MRTFLKSIFHRRIDRVEHGLRIGILIIQIALGLRFMFRVFSLNPGNLLIDLVYRATWPLVAPFEFLTQNILLQGAVFEWSTLLAFLFYTLLGQGLIRWWKKVRR
ncbi:MAG: hypothetical protein WDN67_04605 [Candidatus Moraniibacteriota bacterium]